MVLAIVGCLAGISLPYYLKAQSKAKSLEVQLRLQSFAMALERYYKYYEAFPAFLDGESPLPLSEHFPELIKMLSAEDLKGEPLSPADKATLNPHCRCFLRLNVKDYNQDKTSLRAEGPIYIQVRHKPEGLKLPAPLSKTTLDRVILYTYLGKDLIGSWTGE